MSRRPRVAALIGALLLLAGCAAPAVDVGTAPVSVTAAGPVSGLPTVAVADLPVEAQQTYRLVLEGGPYPYPQDDQAFGNREGLLPAAQPGRYREYTVPTPGSEDRGARRLVVADDGSAYYTDDHYASFREVIP